MVLVINYQISHSLLLGFEFWPTINTLNQKGNHINNSIGYDANNIQTYSNQYTEYSNKTITQMSFSSFDMSVIYTIPKFKTKTENTNDVK